MPIDPRIRKMLTRLEESGSPSFAAGAPDEARARLRMLAVDMRRPETIVPVAAAEDVDVPGPKGDLKVRIYRPDGGGPMPTIVFLHGGGFVLGDVDTHDNQCRIICQNVGAVVASVDYRLAPEDPFPAAVEDCTAALNWAAEQVGDLGGDLDRLAIAGDSAGGNLATVTARLARDAGGPALAAQLLLYPAVDLRDNDDDYPSRLDNGDGYFLTRSDMEWFNGHYLDGADPSDARLSPLLASDLAGLPPAVVVTAEFDPLRDEGELYGRALEAADVPVIVRRYDGLIHGFFDLSALTPAADQAVRDICAELRELLALRTAA